MFPVATKMGGTCNAFPDTCNTPQPTGLAPMPYPNMGTFVQANPATCALKVKVLNQPVLMVQTVISMTSGNEAGSAGGVVSGVIKGPAEIRTGSAKVKVEGKAVAFQTCVVAQNGQNANAPMGVHDTPSQSKVTVGM